MLLKEIDHILYNTKLFDKFSTRIYINIKMLCSNSVSVCEITVKNCITLFGLECLYKVPSLVCLFCI